ncbi:MAG: hypothetical protein Q7R81_04265 [Candidatus Peregrinibacteria bacterium]|nr:hypothetical protein [Candidatus Peregrinibacteria bacterium]
MTIDNIQQRQLPQEPERPQETGESQRQRVNVRRLYESLQLLAGMRAEQVSELERKEVRDLHKCYFDESPLRINHALSMVTSKLDNIVEALDSMQSSVGFKQEALTIIKGMRHGGPSGLTLLNAPFLKPVTGTKGWCIDTRLVWYTISQQIEGWRMSAANDPGAQKVLVELRATLEEYANLCDPVTWAMNYLPPERGSPPGTRTRLQDFGAHTRTVGAVVAGGVALLFGALSVLSGRPPKAAVAWGLGAYLLGYPGVILDSKSQQVAKKIAPVMNPSFWQFLSDNGIQGEGWKQVAETIMRPSLPPALTKALKQIANKKPVEDPRALAEELAGSSASPQVINTLEAMIKGGVAGNVYGEKFADFVQTLRTQDTTESREVASYLVAQGSPRPIIAQAQFFDQRNPPQMGGPAQGMAT